MQRLSADIQHFYVAESAESYTGIPKPLHLTENLHLFEEFADRMTVIVYSGSDRHVGWKREEIARDSLRQAMSDLDPQTIVYFSDLDEFPSAAQVAAMRHIDRPTASRSTRSTAAPTGGSRPRARSSLRRRHRLRRCRTTSPSSAGPTQSTPGLRVSGADTSATSASDADRLAAKVAAFSHSEYLFAMEESQRLLGVADRLALDHFGRSRLPERDS